MRGFLIAILLPSIFLGVASADTNAVMQVGRGSYALRLPEGAQEPQETIHRTSRVTGPIPTSDWWSSLLWLPFSERMFAHPLALQAEAGGLRIFYPGTIHADDVGIFGNMPGAEGHQDLVLGHSAQPAFTDALVDGYSDWFVTAAFGAEAQGVKCTFGHGSPFVYALYTGGGPILRFGRKPTIWSGRANSSVLGVTIDGHVYALFGPSGSTWTGIGTSTLSCAMHGKNYFSVAVLPDASPKTLELFRRYAYAHVTDSRVDWNYDPASASVVTQFSFSTQAYEGNEKGTLFALYPHQWNHSDIPLLGNSYVSICGAMKLAAGSGFTTRMKFPGILPALPDADASGKETLLKEVREEAAKPIEEVKDTYWDGKYLGKLAVLLSLAEQSGDETMHADLCHRLKHRLEDWFTATDANGALKKQPLFYYNKNWGSLIGYKASYASDRDLSDHHFHYGYFLAAAAEIARKDKAWAAVDQWGGMVELLVRDIASPDRNDPMFPFLRNFDPYAGHSWASGTANGGDGNNQESSSEAMNAWSGLILWGQATGNTRLRDLGVYLYTTEMEAIEAYWFDVTGKNHPPSYTPSTVTMLWGGKAVNQTWFSNKPEAVHDINWLPFNGGSLYLGRYPDYVRRNYQALCKEVGGTHWSECADQIWMYHALDDPDDAMKEYVAHQNENFPIDSGGTKANLLHWLGTFQQLGHVDAEVWADYPLAIAFRRGTNRTCVVYNSTEQPLDVRFSDGTLVNCAGPGFTLKNMPVRSGPSSQ